MMNGRGRHRSSSSSLATSSHERPLHPVRRPQKKFSLANAFQPLSSPRRCTPAEGETNVGSYHEETNDKCRSTLNIFSPNFRTRKTSAPLQTRKLSAPVDYRESGVYLGESNNDPVMEIWNKIKERDDSFALNKEEEQKCLTDRIPQTRTPPLESAECSKSLPSIDPSFLPLDEDQCEQECDQAVSISSTPQFRHNVPVTRQCNRLLGSNTNKKNKLRWLSQRVSTSDLLESVHNAAERLEQFVFPKSPSNSSLFVTSCGKHSQRVSASQYDFNNEELDEEPDDQVRQPVERTKSSFYRRSRSFAEEERAKIRPGNTPMSVDLSDAYYDSDQSSGRPRPRGRDKVRTKVAMVQAHSESESIAGERKTSAAKKKRSLADPITKLTLTFLRRKTPSNPLSCIPSTNSANYSPSSSNHPLKVPSREEVRKWAVSFEHLLDHKYGLMLFRVFLQREFSEENIDFWIACEEYKKLRDVKFALHARQIYNDFVAVQAPKEVNLDSVTRSTTMAALTNPNRRSFEQAQHRIQSLMEKDSYPRFLRSDLYLDLVRKC